MGLRFSYVFLVFSLHFPWFPYFIPIFLQCYSLSLLILFLFFAYFIPIVCLCCSCFSPLSSLFYAYVSPVFPVSPIFSYSLQTWNSYVFPIFLLSCGFGGFPELALLSRT